MRKKLIKNRKRLLSLFFFIIFISITVTVAARESNEVYVYSSYEYRSPEVLSSLLSYFDNRPDWEVTEYDLNDPIYSENFFKILDILERKGIEVLPPETCTSCLLAHSTWEEIYLMYASPLVGFFQNGKLMAITVATTDYKILDQASTIDITDSVKIFTSNKTFTLTDEDIRIQLEKTFMEEQNARRYVDVASILPLIITAATVDAINPCGFYVLIVFLSLVSLRIGRKNVLKSGVFFSIAIFITHYLMGFGLLRIVTYFQEAKIFVAVLGLSLGFRAFFNFIAGFFGLSMGLRDIIGVSLNKRFKRIPEAFSKRISIYLREVSDYPIVAFFIGMVSGIFLLPCTSGPYLIALSLITNLETQFEGLFLLTVYNLIIIIPFLVITLGIYTLKLKTHDLKRFSSRKQRWLNLIAGLLMILLSLYLLYEMI